MLLREVLNILFAALTRNRPLCYTIAPLLQPAEHPEATLTDDGLKGTLGLARDIFM